MLPRSTNLLLTIRNYTRMFDTLLEPIFLRKQVVVFKYILFFIFNLFFFLYHTSQATIYFTSVYFNLGACFFDKMRMSNVEATNRPPSLDICICSFPVKVIAGLYFMCVSSEFM